MKFKIHLIILPIFITLIGINESFSQGINLNSVDSTKIKIVNDSTITLCIGQQIDLNFNFCGSSESVVWNNGLTANSIPITQSGTYSVACSSLPNVIIDKVSVIFENAYTEMPVVTRVNLSPLQNCDLKPKIALTASCQGNFSSFEWQDLSTNRTFIAENPGIYSVICRNNCGSSDTTYIEIDSTFLLNNNISVISPSNYFCNTDSLVLRPNIPFVTSDSIYNYFDSIVWSNGQTDSISIINQEGNYYFGLTKIGCSNTVYSDTLEILSGIEKPDMQISLNNQNVLYSTSIQICNYDQLRLEADKCIAGEVQWNNGSMGSVLLITQPGTYFFYCRKNCGSSPPSDTLTVLVENCSISPPVLTANRTSVCSAGDVATITASCDNSDLVWVNPSNNANVQITVGPGVYSAYCQRNSETSSISEIVISIINSTVLFTPTIVTNKTILCSNETATLTSVGCNATVVWSNAMTGTQITVDSGGLYTAICTNFCDSSLVSNSITLMKNSTSPVVNVSTTTICGTENAVLTVTGCPSSMLLWNNGQTGGTIFVSEGRYSVRCTTICGETFDSDTFLISKELPPNKPIIISSTTILPTTGSISLNVTNCNGILQWSNGMNSSLINISQAGYYHVLCINQCGQISSDTIRIQNSNTVLPVIQSSKMSLFPNEIATLSVNNCLNGIIWSTGQTTPTIEVGLGTFTVSCNTIDGFQASFSIIISSACVPICIPIVAKKI